MSILSTEKSLDALVTILKAGAFDYVNESVCQEQIANHLEEIKAEFVKEYDLGKQGVIDFYFPRSRIGLEVKASKLWSKTKVFRQCERYCQSEVISGLLLATARAQALPATVCEKPTRVFYLGECQL